jgi:hypothetical protein
MHLIGLLAVWLSAAALVWVSAFWAPPHIARFQELNMVLPGLTALGVAVSQAIQTWAYPLVVVVLLYSVIHLILLRSFLGLLAGLILATILALPALLVFGSILLADHQIEQALT